MYCTKCGMKNADDALFCAGCGSPMSNPQAAPPVADIQPQPVSNEQFQQEVPQQSYGVSLEKVQPEETASEIAESTVNEPVNDIRENVQVESVEPQNMEQTQFSGQPQSMGQTQFGGQPQSVGQTQFGGQPQGIGQSQFGSQPQTFGQSQFGTPQFSSPQPVSPKKFSVKRFIFSALIIIASIFACACIAMNYVGIEVKMKVQEEVQDIDKDYIKGYQIIKEKSGMDFSEDMEDLIEYDEDGKKYEKEMSDTADVFRIIIIVFEVALVVFTIIDLILLAVVRKRAAYIFTMLFALIKAAIGGFAIWLWCFKFLDCFKNYIEYMLEDYLEYGSISFLISSSVGIGFILAMAMQAVVFICSIVLLTCKNRQKAQTQAY